MSREGVRAGVVRRLNYGLLQAKLFGAALPTLGRFEVCRKLGEGGMGAVFEAVDPRLGRAVALKVLREDGGRNARVDISHEARMLARLSHPNVVTVFELGEEEAEAYVCMEYINGPHLGTWMAQHPEASWRERVQLLLGAARGLAAAHQAGVVHRDFKLENVLIGTDGVPRVTDFGLARVGQPEPTIGADFPREGPTSSLAGTPGYMAPELRTGSPATEKSDQYSFFVALRMALQGVSGTEPRALAALLRQGTSANPAQRLPDMLTVISALEAILVPRVLPDQRARDVLIERVQRLWVDPTRARVARVHGQELPLRSEVLPGTGVLHLDFGEGSAEDIATALHTLQAWVVLTGAPGAGKTHRLLGVAEVLLQRARREADALLPVVLSLSSFPGFSGSFFEWLLHELVAKVALPRDQVKRWLEEGQLALLLDGLDEVAGPARGRCAEALNLLRAERPMPALVTCREETFRGLSPALLCDTVLHLCPLEVPALMGRIASPTLPPGVARMVEGDSALVEQLRNPLLLALFTQVAGDFAGVAPDAGALRERLYPLVLGHALDRAPALQAEDRVQTIAGLHWLAAAMERAGVTELWLEEMQAGWLPSRAQRFAAYALGMGTAYGLSIAINLMASRVAQQPWYSGLFFGIIAVTAAFVIQGGLRVVPMEAMRWSWARVQSWVPRNIALGIVTGGLHGIFFDFWADLMLGVATGLLGLSVIGLVPAGRERRLNPGDGLWESLRNSLVVAPVIGVIIGVPVGYLVLPLARPLASAGSMYHTHPNPELAWAVTMGCSAAVTSLFITGFLAPLMHLALRVVVALSTPLPLHLGHWLDALANRDILYRVGGGWMFRHATFRAWLAEEATRPPG